MRGGRAGENSLGQTGNRGGHHGSAKVPNIRRTGLFQEVEAYMARGFGSSNRSGTGNGSRSSYGVRSSSGGRGTSRSSKSSSVTRSYSQGAKPNGQVRQGKTVQYSIKDRKGNTKYIGSTNNPTRRAAEHRESGKLGRNDKLVVETKPIPRTSAERVEAAKLRSHRQTHGRNPKHNATNDGKFHQPPLFQATVAGRIDRGMKIY